MEIKRGKLHKRHLAELTEAGCFIMEYTVNGEDYTYIVHPVTERSFKD